MLSQMPTCYYNPPATTRRPSKGFVYGKKFVKYNGIKYKTYPEGNKLRRYYFRFFPLGKEITINNLHKFNKNANCAFKRYQLHKWKVAGEDNLDADTTAKILLDNQKYLNEFFDQSDDIDANKYYQIICAKTELKELLLNKNTTQKVCQQTICKNQGLVELLCKSQQLTDEKKGEFLVANPEIIPTVFNNRALTHRQVIDIICSCEALQRIVFESEDGSLECAKCICKQPDLIASLLSSKRYRQQTISMISKTFIKEPSLISCYTPLGNKWLSLPDLIEIVSLAPQLISTIFSFKHIKPEQCAHFIEKLQQTSFINLFTQNQIKKFDDEYQIKTKNHHSLKTLGTTAGKPNQEYQFPANYLLLMLASDPEYLCATCRCLGNNPLRLINGCLYITLDNNFFAVTSKEQLIATPLLATAKHKNIRSLSYFELVQPLTGGHEEIFSPIATLMKDTSDMLNEPMQETKTAQHQKSCEDKVSHLKAVQTNVEILKKLLAEEVTKLTSQSASLSKNDSGTHLFSLETSNQAADGKTHSSSMEREAFLLQETLKIYQNLQSSYENYSHQINQTIHNLQGLLQSLKQLHNSSKQGDEVDIWATLDVLSSARQNIERVEFYSTEISRLNNLAIQIQAANHQLQRLISTFTAFETTAQRIRKETPNKSQASSCSSGKLILLVKKLKKYLAEGNEADSDTLFIKGVDNKLSEMKTTLDENKVDDELSKQILTISTMWESVKSLEIPSGELSKALATATKVAKQPPATLKRKPVNLNSSTTQKKAFLYSNYLPPQPNSTLRRSKSMQNLTGNGKSKNKGNNQPVLGPNQLTRLAIQNLKQALKENSPKTPKVTSTYKQLNGQMNDLYMLLCSINSENNNNARLAFTNQAKEIFNQLVTSIQQFEREAEDTDAVKTAKENLETHFNSLISSLSHDNQSQMGSTIDDSKPDNGKTTLASTGSNKLLDDNELRTPLEAFHTSGSVAPKGTQLVTGLNDKCPPDFLENISLTIRTNKLKRSQSVNLGLNDNCPPDDLASNTTTLQRSRAEFVLGRSKEFGFMIKRLTYDEN